jgi:hypothetical protein
MISVLALSVLALSVVDRMFDLHLVQHKDYDIGICCQQYDSITEKYFRIAELSHRDRRGRDRMVVGFTTTYAISAYQH